MCKSAVSMDLKEEMAAFTSQNGAVDVLLRVFFFGT